MAYGPFFSELDSRAEVKGSRDPLGLQQIWTKLGRCVVGNLTTVSNSLRDFTTLMVGLYFAERVADQQGNGAELGAFLRWEQLAAYSRATHYKGTPFRGVEVVRRRLDGREKLVLSRGHDGAILSDQKTYGLWGLYTVPARLSGLMNEGASTLRSESAAFVEKHYLPRLTARGQSVEQVRKVVSDDGYVLRHEGRDQNLLRAVANILDPKLTKSEVDFYREHLLYGGPTNAIREEQTVLAELLGETLKDREFVLSPKNVARLAQDARSHGTKGADVAARLDQLRVCEAIIAPMSRLFSYLLGSNDRPLAALALELREQWGDGIPTINVEAFGDLREFLPIAEGDKSRWVRIADHARNAAYSELIRELVAMNQSVMQTRGGAPWIKVENDRLLVSYRDEHGHLPERQELEDLWVFPYFLESLRSIGLPLRGA